MKYKLLILCLAVCQLAFAQDNKMTLDSLNKMNPVGLTINQDRDVVTIRGNKGVDFKKDSLNYILHSNCNVLRFNSVTSSDKKLSIIKNDNSNLKFFCTKETFHEDKDPRHVIKQDEEVFVWIDTVGKQANDTLACISIGITYFSKGQSGKYYPDVERTKAEAKNLFVIKPEVKIDSTL